MRMKATTAHSTAVTALLSVDNTRFAIRLPKAGTLRYKVNHTSLIGSSMRVEGLP
jgi:hypothetical protein